MPSGVHEHHRKLTDTEKEHLSQFWKGKKKSDEHKLHIKLSKQGEKNPIYGTSPSQETRLKRSKSLKGKAAWNKGKKCPQLVTNWKGGVSKENHIVRHSMELRSWKNDVFKRDDWTCQSCKIRGTTLNSHHILNFSDHIELRFVVENGITFCKSCHKDFHNTFGQNHNTRDQLEKFLLEQKNAH